MHFEEEIRKRFSDFHFDSMLQSEKRDACATDLTDPLLEILGFKSFLLCFFFGENTLGRIVTLVLMFGISWVSSAYERC